MSDTDLRVIGGAALVFALLCLLGGEREAALASLLVGLIFRSGGASKRVDSA